MADVGVEYFITVATVIPVLAIATFLIDSTAVGVTKLDSRQWAWYVDTLGSIFVIFAGAAEMGSLLAIIRGGAPRFVAAAGFFTLAALTFSLSSAGMAVSLKQVPDRLRQRATRWVEFAFLVMTILGTVAVFFIRTP